MNLHLYAWSIEKSFLYVNEKADTKSARTPIIAKPIENSTMPLCDWQWHGTTITFSRNNLTLV